MIEQINTELLKLQDELNKFDGAVKKIAQAGEITETLLENSENLQKSFGEQLQKIEGLFSDYMNKTYSHTETKISKIFEHFQERLKQEEQVLEKYTKLTDQNSSLTHEFYEKIASDNNKQISYLVNEATKNLEEQNEFIKLQKVDFQSKINKMIESHNKKIKSEQTVLDNYLELASSTAELSKFLKTVDFPTKLGSIQKQIEEAKAENNKNFNELKAENNQNFTKSNSENKKRFDKIDNSTTNIKNTTQAIIDDPTGKTTLENVNKIIANDKSAEILNSTKKINSKVKSTRFFVVLIFILTLLFFAFFTFVFFNFFPHFFEDIL